MSLSNLNLFKLNLIKFKGYVGSYQQLSLSFISNSKMYFKKPYLKKSSFFSNIFLSLWYSNLKNLINHSGINMDFVNNFFLFFKNLNYNYNLNFS